MNEKKSYFVGSTVTLRVSVTAPDDDVPEDATTVTLDGLVSGSTRPTISSPNFTHSGTGAYTYFWDTTGLAPGAWTWRAKVVTPDGVAYEEDTLVLRARS
jgi:hypothetical protein